MDIKHEEFITALRSALHYLYDPDQLRRCSLAVMLGVSERVDSSSAVQKILLESIETLKPGDDEPPQSKAWLIYDVLFFRYVRGYDRGAVANQLGISDRQFSREQRTAIEVLGVYLWENFHPKKSQRPHEEGEAAVKGSSPIKPDMDNQDWIDDLPPEKPAAWKGGVLSVLDLIRPIARENEVFLRYEPDEDLPDLIVPQYALRHALLNILSMILAAVHQGELNIDIKIEDRFLVIWMKAVSTPGQLLQAIEPDQVSLDLVRQLARRAEGSFTISFASHEILAALKLPILQQIPVLVVDDNADTLQLFQRYAQGTRYSVTGVQDPMEAYRVMERVKPRAILLDVMMPDMDGWELLQQLQQASSASIPIVVCSILPQESLARSLGADAFLRKPVLPRDFLLTLDQLLDDQLVGDQ